jgi:hypothetical protein
VQPTTLTGITRRFSPAILYDFTAMLLGKKKKKTFKYRDREIEIMRRLNKKKKNTKKIALERIEYDEVQMEN